MRGYQELSPNTDIAVTLRSIVVFFITLASPLFSEGSTVAQEVLSGLESTSKCLLPGPGPELTSHLLPCVTAVTLKCPSLSSVYHLEKKREKTRKFYTKCKIAQTTKKKKKGKEEKRGSLCLCICPALRRPSHLPPTVDTPAPSVSLLWGTEVWTTCLRGP